MSDNPKPKILCTVQILTLNSAHILRRCLESVKDFDDILICDGNSTDDTLSIAREYTDHIIKQVETDEPNIRVKDFATLRNKCIVEGRYDWNLYIDTDEELPTRTTEEIRKIVTNPIIEHYIYRLPGHINYNRQEIKHSVAYPGYQMRFMNRKSGIQHTRTPHSRLTFDPKKFSVGTLKNPWFVIIEPGKGNPAYEPAINRGHIQIEIRQSVKNSLGHFLLWAVWRRGLSLINVIIKTFWLYLRHGFKDTLPPWIEFKRIHYKWLLFYGAIKFRIRLAVLGEKQKHETTPAH